MDAAINDHLALRSSLLEGGQQAPFSFKDGKSDIPPQNNSQNQPLVTVNDFNISINLKQFTLFLGRKHMKRGMYTMTYLSFEKTLLQRREDSLI